MKKALKVFVALLLVIVIGIVAIASYVKLALPDVGPAPDLKVDITPEKVKRGEYLANHVMVCMDCHSERNWNAFAAPPVPGTLGKGGGMFGKNEGFPGEYYAPNITPAGLKGWTDGEIFRAITTGVRKNGKPIFPVMPHSSYGRIDEQDITSVIAYIRTLPAIENSVPASRSDFPMNFIINTIPKKASLHPRPDTADKVNYGKYLVTAAACADCHTPFEKGQLVTSMLLAGGREFQMPGGILRSANITPDTETGIGNWNREAFISRFKMYNDSAWQQNHAAAKDFNTIMPWTMYAGMTEQDLGAIYDYLKSVSPIQQKVVKHSPAAVAAE